MTKVGNVPLFARSKLRIGKTLAIVHTEHKIHQKLIYGLCQHYLFTLVRKN